jgi:Caspase domain
MPLSKGMYTKPAPLGGTHVALCIGNSKYVSSPLNNTTKDAKDLAALCEKLGFATELVLDASRNDMIDAVEAFVRKLSRGGVSLLFFSGAWWGGCPSLPSNHLTVSFWDRPRHTGGRHELPRPSGGSGERVEAQLRRGGGAVGAPAGRVRRVPSQPRLS